MTDKNKIYEGDALKVLKTFPDNFIDCVVTSPPYYNLRDYETENQIGQEETPDKYIENLINIFNEIKRILKNSGSCWINIADSYSSNKSLYCIPFRLAIRMTDNGWILRNTIIWKKTNSMPSSASDRFTNDFEYLFFFVKSESYYFKKQYEDFAESTFTRIKYGLNSQKLKSKKYAINNDKWPRWTNDIENSKGRNMRSVWEISTEKFHGEHFAVFPEKLIKIPIDATCPEKIETNNSFTLSEVNNDGRKEYEKGIVLDPFMGSGTTALVALKQNKNFIGIELNPEYIKIAEKRIKPFLIKQNLFN